ncbi:MAG: hypothetical protein COB16_11645 [Rhodobacteraceae bacterium]|nr:MAG: hypothetical protein COB16_11645 [Paracoccaceae bacterium]
MTSYKYVDPILRTAEDLARTKNTAAVYNALRTMPLADFIGLSGDNLAKSFPHLAKHIATMPTPEVQARWTGHSGHQLLTKSCNLVRLLQLQSYHLRGRDIGSGPILDYGCGWGRLTRAMGYFADPDLVHGCDPMAASLELCNKHGVRANLHQIDPIPAAFPLSDILFDLVFSYSVMSHTSMESTMAILRTVRSVIAPDGFFATTIRPVEFWAMRSQAFGEERTAALASDHNRTGYAFVEIGGGEGLSKNHYGDTSFSIERFTAMAEETGWRLARIDRDTLEQYQILMVLQPV